MTSKSVSLVAGGLIFVLFCFTLLLPFLASDYILHICILSCLWIIVALSLGLLIGYVGMMSFGHAAFMGIGAYTSALLTTKLSFPFWPALILAALMAGVFGLIIGIITLKLRGPYFSVVTLAFGEIVHILLNNWNSLTNGAIGVRGIKPPDPLLFFSFHDKFSYYYLALFMVAVTALIIRRIVYSQIGRALVSVREDEDLAQCLGINATYYKVLFFSVSTMLTGLAGSLYAHYILFISPPQFTVFQSIEFVLMVIFGGAGTILGPLLGAVILVVLPQFLYALDQLRMVAYGAILILVISFLPKGIIGLWATMTNSEKKFPAIRKITLKTILGIRRKEENA